jgi:hypothetical protein
MAPMVPMVPGPGIQLLVVFITGLLLVLAAIGLITEKYIQQLMIILGVFLFLTALLIHLPHWLNGENNFSRMNGLTEMLKDLALAGAAFFISASSPK